MKDCPGCVRYCGACCAKASPYREKGVCSHWNWCLASLALVAIAGVAQLHAREVPWSDFVPRPTDGTDWSSADKLGFAVDEKAGMFKGVYVHEGLGSTNRRVYWWRSEDGGFANRIVGLYHKAGSTVSVLDEFTADGYSKHGKESGCDGTLIGERRSFVRFFYAGDLVFEETSDCAQAPPFLLEIRGFVGGDLDDDGLEDVVGEFEDGRVVWWRQPSDRSVAGNWPQVTLGLFDSGGTGKRIGDIDRDGDNDIVLFTYDPHSDRTAIHWLENYDATEVRVFRDRPIDEIAGRPAGVHLGYVGTVRRYRGLELIDLDLDGDLDLVAVVETEGGGIAINWWENAGSDGLVWVNRGWLISYASGTDSLQFGDIDMDGDYDILNGSVWCENNGGLSPETWTYHEVPVPEGHFVGCARLTDFDHDGDLDIIYYYLYEVYFLENRLPADTVAFMEKRLVADGFDQGNDVQVGDLDRDGDLDIAAAAWWDDAVRVWKNDGAFIPTWTVTPIDDELDGAQSIAIADIDGDTWPDLVGAATGLDSVLWWSNRAGAWDRHVIQRVDASRDVAVMDFEGDRDLDIAAAVTADDALSLWVNDGTPRTGDWLRESITPGGSLVGAWDVVAGDIDGDGDDDLAASAETDGEIKWYENTLISGVRVMLPHDVADGLDGVRGIDLADLDGDGDIDVVGAVGTLDLIIWWENTGGQPIYWVTHFVGSGFEGAIDVLAHDIDGDLDLDVIGAAETAGAITWWENTQGDAIHWDEHRVTTDFPEVRALALADLDRNGAPDIVAVAGRPTNEVAWWPNAPRPWRGVVTVAHQRYLLPALPAGMFSVDVSHGGESAGPALLVDGWRVRLERAAGVPMTGPLLDQLVESISVYEDDGDGSFGSGDTLLFEDSALTIDASGLVTVDPPSPEATPTVEPGESARFILVLTPTASAHQAGLDTLLLTPVRDFLLHPEGSDEPVPVAEYRPGAHLDLRILASGTDLTGGDLVAPAEVVTGHTYEVSWRTLDPSELEMGWRDRIVLSRDPVYQKDLVYEAGSDDRILKTYDWVTPAADVGFTAHDTFQVPRVSPGVYHLIISLDENELLKDIDLANNQLSVPIRVLAPDLVPYDLTAPPVWETQQTVTIAWDVENRGDGEALPWRDDLWLSTEPNLEGAVAHLDYLEGSTSLAIGATIESSIEVTVPPVSQGFYYLILECDRYNRIHEYSEHDQLLIGEVIVIGPDLVATGFNAPAVVVPGTRIDIDWSVVNQGEAAGGLSEDAVYFSTDRVWNAGDTQLSWKIAPALGSGEEYLFWDTRIDLPTSEPGRYYLLLAVDYAQAVIECDETNNLVAHPIEITDPGEPRPISSIERVPGLGGTRCRLAVSSALGQSFQIESSPNLSPESWTPVTLYSSAGGEIGLTELAGTGFEIPVFVAIDEFRAFFRVRVAE